MEKKLDGNYTRMLRAVLNQSWRQHPTKQQLYGHLSPITKTIQIRRTRHVRLCWRSKDKLKSDILRWTLLHERAKVGRPARAYIQQLYAEKDVAWKTSPERWTIETDGKRGSVKSDQAARHDDEDDIERERKRKQVVSSQQSYQQAALRTKKERKTERKKDR